MDIYNYYHEKCSAESVGSTFVAPSGYPTAGGGCANWWIGDSICDDECRSEECEFDGGDCAEGNLCGTDFCASYFSEYLDRFAIPSVAGANIRYLCDDIVADDAELLYMVSTRTKQECNELFPRFDFNKDGVMILLILTPIGEAQHCGDLFRFHQLSRIYPVDEFS